MAIIRRLPINVYLAIIGLVIGLLLLTDWAVDYLWFDALSRTDVFWLLRLLKLGLFAAVFALVLLYFRVNLRLLAAHMDFGFVARALAKRFTTGSFGSGPVAGPGMIGVEKSDVLALGLFLLALIFALYALGQWDIVLRFVWAQEYGQSDPIFGRDIGFYLFELPFWEQLRNTALALFFLGTLLVVAAYSEAGMLQTGWRTQQLPARVRWHIAVNLALFLVVLAWGYFLDRFALLQSNNGAVYGAGYADVYIVRPALWLVAGMTLVLALLALFFPVMQRWRATLLVVVGYLLLVFVALVALPWVVQSYLVEPNELELETPFLRHNIALTRQGFGLDRVDERRHGGADAFTPSVLASNRQTIDNIRLWDWRPLSQTFRQLQQIRSYYAFGDVDVDRYRFDGQYRQVMLAVRELADELPAKANTWLNRYLQYTHGYGLAMSLTADKDGLGGPVLVVKDLPPQANGLVVSQPAVYYGENMSDYRIVATGVKEFDYPRGDENVYTRYQGHGGIPLDTFWKRLLFAWHQFDAGILITSYITPESRIQLWRRVQERVARIAPFLRLDDDPYPVLDDGRLYWVQDAYTVSGQFPYAEPYGDEFNYIRNSVKVVVDAYHGEVNFYVVDPDDPVLAVYRQALPDLFIDLERMPAGLRGHLRYPLDLFAAQVEKYSTYHMTVSQVFYNGEDLWSVPREKYGGEVIAMKPYYVLMRLPAEERLQFLLMTPLTPRNRDNMIAWMAARNDFPGYGELIVYKLPKMRLILGPMQVEAMIDQDTSISQQLSLWDQRGSRVIRGNLLVIPLGQSFIYVEPVYLIAEETDIPQLKRVIVSDGERLAMEPTLAAALAAVAGGRQEEPMAARDDAEDQRLAAARVALAEAEAALRAGDWEGFGAAMQSLKTLLGQ